MFSRATSRSPASSRDPGSYAPNRTNRQFSALVYLWHADPDLIYRAQGGADDERTECGTGSLNRTRYSSAAFDADRGDGRVRHLPERDDCWPRQPRLRWTMFRSYPGVLAAEYVGGEGGHRIHRPNRGEDLGPSHAHLAK